MKLSIAVMAHPKRAQFFPYLREKLGDVPFFIDEGVGLLQNCRNAWSCFDKTADYHLVVQDDALLCENFLERAHEVLKLASGKPVSFIYISPIPFIKRAKEIYDAGHILDGGLSGGVAICLPTNLIPGMLRHYDALKLPHDDHRIGNYILTKNIQIYHPIPSLVDHRVGNESVFWKRTSLHSAYDFIDNNTKKPA